MSYADSLNLFFNNSSNLLTSSINPNEVTVNSLVIDPNETNEHNLTLTAPTLTNDRSVIFPDRNIEVNKVEDLSGSTLPSSIISSSLTSLGNISNLNATRLLVDNGSAAAPSISFKNDGALNTGFYLKSENVVGFSASGGEQILFDVSGIDLPSGDRYAINGISVLSATTLGETVVSSSLQSLGTLDSLQVNNINIDGNTISSTAGNIVLSPFGISKTEVSSHINLYDDKEYQIDGQPVLTKTSIGPTVLGSSLTSVGKLNLLDIDDIRINNSDIMTTTTDQNLGIFPNGTGQVVFNDGSPEKPSIVFYTLNDAGIYMNDNKLNFAYAGALHTSIYSNKLNLASGNVFAINGTDVLSATTLGSNVTTSSLTSVGTLSTLQVDNIYLNNKKLGINKAIPDSSITIIKGDTNQLDINPGETSIQIGIHKNLAGEHFAGIELCSDDNKRSWIDFNNGTLSRDFVDRIAAGLGFIDFFINTSGFYTVQINANGINLAENDYYSINGSNVLSANTLGTGVTSSSLTSVGTLSSLRVDNINIDNNTISTISASNEDINITPDGTGKVNFPKLVTLGDSDLIDDEPVLRILSDRAWEFTQKSEGASAALGLRPYGQNDKDFVIYNSTNVNETVRFKTHATAANLKTTFNCGMYHNMKALENSDSPYTLTTQNYVLNCNTTSGAITIILPSHTTHSGKIFYINDVSGTADTNNIFIDSSTNSTTLNNSSSSNFSINTKYAHIMLFCNGSGWFATSQANNLPSQQETLNMNNNFISNVKAIDYKIKTLNQDSNYDMQTDYTYFYCISTLSVDRIFYLMPHTPGTVIFIKNYCTGGNLLVNAKTFDFSGYIDGSYNATITLKNGESLVLINDTANEWSTLKNNLQNLGDQLAPLNMNNQKINNISKLNLRVKNIIANAHYTLENDYSIFDINIPTQSENRSIYLQSGTYVTGDVIHFKNIDSNGFTITLEARTADSMFLDAISGGTYTLNQYDSITLYNSGGNYWNILGSH